MTSRKRLGSISLALSGLLMIALTGCSNTPKMPATPKDLPAIKSAASNQKPLPLYLQRVGVKLVNETALVATIEQVSYDEAGNILINGKPFLYPLNVQFADVCFASAIDSKAMDANWLDVIRLLEQNAAWEKASCSIK